MTGSGGGADWSCEIERGRGEGEERGARGEDEEGVERCEVSGRWGDRGVGEGGGGGRRGGKMRRVLREER